MQANKMKGRFAAGQPAFGLSVMIPSAQIVEMAAGVGFDWVLIDCEHGSIGPADIELMAMACDAVAFLGIGLVLAAGLYTLQRERLAVTANRIATPHRSPAE